MCWSLLNMLAIPCYLMQLLWTMMTTIFFLLIEHACLLQHQSSLGWRICSSSYFPSPFISFSNEHGYRFDRLYFFLFLIFRCASSSLNGGELVRDGGIKLLATLLSRCMCVVQLTTSASEPSAVIVTNVMHTFSVLSQFESARAEMLELSGLVDDIVHCTELELVPDAVDAAL